MKKPSNPAEKASATEEQGSLPPHIQDLFGKPPVLSTENRDIYKFILLDIAKEIRPRTTFEWFWVKDLADIIWEIRRYRSAIVSIMDVVSKAALKSILESTEVPSYAPEIVSLEKSEANFWKKESFADKWYGSPDERAEVSAELAKYELDADAIAGEAFVLRKNQIYTLQMLIERGELRRDRILREIGYFRETLAETLDPLVRKMIDGKPSDVPLIPKQEAA
jgi:hypothetical protein